MKTRLFTVLTISCLGCGQGTVSAPNGQQSSTVVDPTDPNQPTDPVTPVDPTDPVAPVDPTDQNQPTDPVTPVDPTDPNQPTDPVTPTPDCIVGSTRCQSSSTLEACLLGTDDKPHWRADLCSDGNVCNGIDTCNDLTDLSWKTDPTKQPKAECVAGLPPEVDDQNACTIDGCDLVLGVFHLPVTVNDDNACTIDSCDPVFGVTHSAVVIDDGDACTFDSCDQVTGVHNELVNINDGDACTVDTCDATTGIHHTPIDIDDADVCTIDSCDSTLGVTHTSIPVDDGKSCTIDSCDPVTGMHHVFSALGTLCSDGNACNGEETCDGHGICLPGTVPSPLPCACMTCPTGTTRVETTQTCTCVDAFEASINNAATCDGTFYGVGGSPLGTDYPAGFPYTVSSDNCSGTCNSYTVTDPTVTMYACNKEDAKPSIATWFQAKRACENTGKHLCTGDEWVPTCEGDSPHVYPYGDTYNATACNGYDLAHPSEDARLSSLTSICTAGNGTFEMSGNVAEWTSDCTTCTTWPCTCVNCDSGHPTGCSSRGGSLNDDRNSLTCESKVVLRPNFLGAGNGFRCCTDIGLPECTQFSPGCTDEASCKLAPSACIDPGCSLTPGDPIPASCWDSSCLKPLTGKCLFNQKEIIWEKVLN